MVVVKMRDDGDSMSLCLRHAVGVGKKEAPGSLREEGGGCQGLRARLAVEDVLSVEACYFLYMVSQGVNLSRASYLLRWPAPLQLEPVPTP